MEILDEVRQRAAVLHAQGKPVKDICEELRISQRTLWQWKKEPLFIEHERAYRKLAWDTCMHGTVALGQAAVKKLLMYLAEADHHDEQLHKVAISSLRLLHQMGKGTDQEEPIKRGEKVTLSSMIDDLTGSKVDDS